MPPRMNGNIYVLLAVILLAGALAYVVYALLTRFSGTVMAALS